MLNSSPPFRREFCQFAPISSEKKYAFGFIIERIEVESVTVGFETTRGRAAGMGNSSSGCRRELAGADTPELNSRDNRLFASTASVFVRGYKTHGDPRPKTHLINQHAENSIKVQS